MQEINNTQYFKVQKDQVIEVKDVIARVYEALTEKGYNPVNQILKSFCETSLSISAYNRYKILKSFCETS